MIKYALWETFKAALICTPIALAMTLATVWLSVNLECLKPLKEWFEKDD